MSETRTITIFNSSHFVATEWSTAEDKAAFANRFVRFVRSDFDAKHFSEKFYRRLSNTFGHIAHCNRLGFCETFFTTTADKVRFLTTIVQWPCYGDPAFTFSDVEAALQAWLQGDGTLPRYRQKFAKEIEATERAELSRLQRKYA